MTTNAHPYLVAYTRGADGGIMIDEFQTDAAATTHGQMIAQTGADLAYVGHVTDAPADVRAELDFWAAFDAEAVR